MKGRRTSFAGATCLVTGAASGIGRATAAAIAARGGRLVLTDIQADALAEVATELGPAVLDAHRADVSDHEAVRELAAKVGERHGSLDVVLNVAGISTWGSVERLRHSDWQRMIDVNLMGPINVIESFVPPMIEAGRGGHLVNVSSAAGLLGLPWHAAYSASKFGIRGVSEVLRFDLRRADVGVTLVCPGAVATPLVSTVEIVGIDRDHPAARRMVDEFLRKARTPEQVAASILDGVERGRYLVFTSRDIQAAYWLQRFAPPLYERLMMSLNRRLLAVAEKAAEPDPKPGARPAPPMR
jgi:NAD(P)-dependent dehydrogenase (short-subunit alcohol dehydrogenase family)